MSKPAPHSTLGNPGHRGRSGPLRTDRADRSTVHPDRSISGYDEVNRPVHVVFWLDVLHLVINGRAAVDKDIRWTEQTRSTNFSDGAQVPV
jgi:hypothetical protein